MKVKIIQFSSRAPSCLADAIESALQYILNKLGQQLSNSFAWKGYLWHAYLLSITQPDSARNCGTGLPQHG